MKAVTLLKLKVTPIRFIYKAKNENYDETESLVSSKGNEIKTNTDLSAHYKNWKGLGYMKHA